MGLMDKVKGVFGGEKEEDTVDEEWEIEDDEFEDDDWEEDDEWEDDDEEEEMQTWDTYYQFADDALQHRGFSGVNEFVKKAMVFRINRDPANRDRIKTGRQTMQMVGDTMEIIDSIGDDDNDDWETKAEKLENAARVKSAIDDFQNKEEEMVRDIMGIAQNAVNTWADKREMPTGNVDTTTRTSSEEL